ncbi:hypothetical protein M3Y98_00997100 [Aphelenchoides besseyi]|nr:hypothetical protein M3Y98_00997100 [Aphelenchoides besseyi]KAI6195118.1 hypothetical protein M3Y96_01196900 [Aphelenchoides besseyi]
MKVLNRNPIYLVFLAAQLSILVVAIIGWFTSTVGVDPNTDDMKAGLIMAQVPVLIDSSIKLLILVILFVVDRLEKPPEHFSKFVGSFLVGTLLFIVATIIFTFARCSVQKLAFWLLLQSLNFHIEGAFNLFHWRKHKRT